MPFPDDLRDIHLKGNTQLAAGCRKTNGSECQSNLDLNEHIGNKEGVFDLDGKNFSASARQVRLEDSLLCAELRSSTGHWHQDSIDLNAVVENRDGMLVFKNKMDRHTIRPDGWQPVTGSARQRDGKGENIAAPVLQCQLCEDWPYIHVRKRIYDQRKLNATKLKSTKRKADCPTCILAERVVYELVPKLAEPRKVKTESITLELAAHLSKLPRFNVKFENEVGEKHELDCIMHTRNGEVNLSKFYANIPTAGLLSGSSTCPSTVSLAKQWLNSCVEKHEKCRNERNTPLPARILDIGTDPEGFVRLKTTKNEQAVYACLSHCWGTTKALTLTKQNYNDYHQKIDLSTLPKVYTDAITHCRCLGIRYIWIDALCIVQDDAEDWKREFPKMYSYYGECYVCLAATSAGDHDGNCSVRNLTLKHEGYGHDGLPYSIYIRPEVPHIVYSSKFSHAEYFPLLERAWVYQERRLSPRVLHITDMELCFECNTTTCCECGCGDQNYSVKGWTKSLETFYAGHKDVSDLEEGPTKFEHEWHSIVHAYSRLNLTKESDRLPALSGLAQSSVRRRATHDSTAGRYLAGCWEKSLINDLAWAVGPPLVRITRNNSGGFGMPSLIPDSHTFAKQPKPSSYIAPSWSWACILDQVKYGPFGYSDHLCKVEEAHVDLASQDQFGQVRGGWLILSAKVIPTRWLWQKVALGPGYASLQDIGSTRRFWGLVKDKGMKWWRDWADGEHHQLKPNENLYLMPLAARKLLGRSDSAEFNFKLIGGVTVTETTYLVLRRLDEKAQPMIYERVGWASRSSTSRDPDFDSIESISLKLI